MLTGANHASKGPTILSRAAHLSQPASHVRQEPTTTVTPKLRASLVQQDTPRTKRDKRLATPVPQGSTKSKRDKLLAPTVQVAKPRALSLLPPPTPASLSPRVTNKLPSNFNPVSTYSSPFPAIEDEGKSYPATKPWSIGFVTFLISECSCP